VVFWPWHDAVARWPPEANSSDCNRAGGYPPARFHFLVGVRIVTAAESELGSANHGLLAELRSVSRDEFFAGLYIISCANGLLGRVLLTLTTDGWVGILDVNISVIVLFACFAGVSTTLQTDQRIEKIGSTDLAVGAVCLALAVLPMFALAWVALSGLSLYVLCTARGDSGRRRGALIMLTLTLPMLWSPLLMRFFAAPILKVDSAFAAWVLGTDRVGNTVGLADGSGYMAVSPACSSLGNISLAILCWVSATQWLNRRWRAIDVVWVFLICGSVVVLNVARISLTGLSKSHYESIHSPFGTMVGGYIVLASTVALTVASARRELFSRA
jgi:exosortase/archaeosortase family protein